MKKMNKTKLATLVAAITVTSIIAAPIAQARGPHGHGNAEARIQAVFERLDTSGDGVIDSTELTAKALEKSEKIFDHKDADDDGFLSFEEASTTRRGAAQDHSDIADDIVQCVADLKEETGNDSIIVPSADKFDSPEDKFNAADTSGDGVLDLSEAQAKATEKAETGFALMDADSNGQVTLEEFTAHNQSKHATRRAVRQCIQELSAEDEVV